MDHAATVRRFYDLINAGDIDGFGALLADDLVEHERLPGLEPTKLIDIMGMGADGLCHEHWGVMDQLTMMQQVGAIPAGPPASSGTCAGHHRQGSTAGAGTAKGKRVASLGPWRLMGLATAKAPATRMRRAIS
jgi:ketosteroid isomerase-like protein